MPQGISPKIPPSIHLKFLQRLIPEFLQRYLYEFIVKLLSKKEFWRIPWSNFARGSFNVSSTIPQKVLLGGIPSWISLSICSGIYLRIHPGVTLGILPVISPGIPISACPAISSRIPAVFMRFFRKCLGIPFPLWDSSRRCSGDSWRDFIRQV